MKNTYLPELAKGFATATLQEAVYGDLLLATINGLKATIKELQEKQKQRNSPSYTGMIVKEITKLQVQLDAKTGLYNSFVNMLHARQHGTKAPMKD